MDLPSRFCPVRHTITESVAGSDFMIRRLISFQFRCISRLLHSRCSFIITFPCFIIVNMVFESSSVNRNRSPGSATVMDRSLVVASGDDDLPT